MTNFLLKRILIFFDYFHKKKIIDNLKDLDFNNRTHEVRNWLNNLKV